MLTILDKKYINLAKRGVVGMRFMAYGPFEMGTTNAGQIDQAQQSLWQTAEKQLPGISGACGCYIFAINSSGGGPAKPWYAGKANKQTFQQECFTSRNTTTYTEIFWSYDRARAQLYLLPRLTSTGRFSKPSTQKNGHVDINKLEDILIGLIYKRNPDVANKKGLQMLKNIVVPGIINSDTTNPGTSARKLRKVLGF